MKVIAPSLLFLILSACTASTTPKYKNPTIPIEDRIDDLLSRMTLEEKVLQLNQLILGENTNVNNFGKQIMEFPPEIGSLINANTDPSIRNSVQKRAVEQTRLGIPILFGQDVIHGFRTIYPISLAQACSFNPMLVQEACAVAAKEAKRSGIDWTFSPMVDVARDPRWGRVSEGYGEDPYLNSVFAVASVKGYQGKSLGDPFSIAACLKHYVGYGASEGGRDYHYTEVSAQTLWDTYMPAYKAAIEAGAATVMSAFNDISGIPASANHYTLSQILKNRWKHDGFVVSDWNSIEQLQYQGFAADPKQAALLAFESGVEMDMKDMLYADHLATLLHEKKISQKQIDDAVRRVLRIKFRLGLFESPYTPEVPEKERYLSDSSKAVALQLAEESIVLLKNDNKLLPLKRSKIALIGPIVDDSIHVLGSWSCHGQPSQTRSIAEELKRSLGPDVLINKAIGCDFDQPIKGAIDRAISVASQSDVVILCLGEKSNWSGENGSKSSIALPQVQEDLAIKMAQLGKPIVLVLSSGRPLELIRLEPLAQSILHIWQPGTMTGMAVANILTGAVNPSAKLAMTFPLTTGQIPIYYNARKQARSPYQNTGQGRYVDISNDPLYPFGFGLSYTNYKYGKVVLSATQVKRSQRLRASVEVYNSGDMDGKQICLWYISDPYSSITRPIKELKYFEKKEIKTKQKYNFVFEIDPIRDLSFVDSDGKPLLEKGLYHLWVGDQQVSFELTD